MAGMIQECHNLVRPCRVKSLEPCGSVFLSLDDGTTMFARSVIAALGGGEPVWPRWAPSAEPPTLVHSEEVDLSTLEGRTGRLLVVGGGLTAGHFVLGALKRGWSVDLVTRRPVTYKLFDAAPGWIGPKFMTGSTANRMAPTPQNGSPCQGRWCDDRRNERVSGSVPQVGAAAHARSVRGEYPETGGGWLEGRLRLGTAAVSRPRVALYGEQARFAVPFAVCWVVA